MVNLGWIPKSNIDSAAHMKVIDETLTDNIHQINGIIDESVERKPYFMKEADLVRGYFPFRDTSKLMHFLGFKEGLETETNLKSKTEIMLDSRVVFVKQTEPLNLKETLNLNIIPCNKDPLRETPHLEYFFTWLSLGGLSTIILLS